MPDGTVIGPDSYCALCGSVEVRRGFRMRTFPGRLLHFFLRPAQPGLPQGELRLHLDCGKTA